MKNNTIKLLENMNQNLSEDISNDINNMTIDDMIKKYTDICKDASVDIFSALDQLKEYGCLNTGSFRNMLIDTIDYINDNT